MAVLRTASGLTVTVRTATPDDLDAVNDLHAHCSPQTLISRYVAGRSSLHAREWRRMVDPNRGRTLVLTDPADSGTVLGFANVLGCSDGLAEASLLLRDDWQGIGLGRAVARHLLATAAHLRFAGLVAWIAADNTRARRLLCGIGAQQEFTDGELRWVVRAG